jgi:hypothetical protein
VTTALPILPVSADGSAAPALDVDAAVEFYARVSGGRVRLAPFALPPVALPRPLGWYTPAGGMGRPPHNSQELIDDALAQLGADERERLARAGDRLLIAAPRGLHAHTWRVRGGGFHLGGARWCRFYSVLPDAAPPGAIAHELGHLLFDWPDLDRSVGDDCLMALGGARAGGYDPAPPCAPLVVGAGWRSPFSVAGTTLAGELDGAPGRFVFDGRPLIIERRADGGPARLVTYDERAPAPRLLHRVPLAAGDDERPLLALLAPSLQRA